MSRQIAALLAVAFICFAAAPALASCELSSTRIGQELIRVGDSERRVIQMRPDREVSLQTAQGGAAGFRFDFYQQRQTVQVYTAAGRVTRICHVRD